MNKRRHSSETNTLNCNMRNEVKEEKNNPDNSLANATTNCQPHTLAWVQSKC